MEIMGADVGAGDFEGSDLLCLHVNDSILILQRPSIRRNRLRVTTMRSRSKISGVMMTLAMPVSSSRERKTNPFAVPGRCRAITHPAMLTKLLLRGVTQVVCCKNALRAKNRLSDRPWGAGRW